MKKLLIVAITFCFCSFTISHAMRKQITLPSKGILQKYLHEADMTDAAEETTIIERLAGRTTPLIVVICEVDCAIAEYCKRVDPSSAATMQTRRIPIIQAILRDHIDLSKNDLSILYYL